jgi:hypothetical protein
MPRPSTIDGKRYIKIRVSEKFYKFITELSKRFGMSTSELCRSALEISFMAMYVGKINSIEKQFYKRYFKPFQESMKRSRKGKKS